MDTVIEIYKGVEIIKIENPYNAKDVSIGWVNCMDEIMYVEDVEEAHEAIDEELA